MKKQVPKRFRVFAVVLVFVSLLVLVRTDMILHDASHLSSVIGVMVFGFIAEFFLIRYPINRSYASSGLWMSVSTPLVCASIALYGWSAGVWVDACITLFPGLMNARLKHVRSRWVIWNTAQSILSAFAAGMVFQWLMPSGFQASWWGIAGLLLAFITYLMVNTLLVSYLMVTTEQHSMRWLFSQLAKTTANQLLAMFPLTLLVTVATASYGLSGLVAVLVPYLALRHALLAYAKQNAFYHQTIRNLGFIIQRAHPYTGGHLQRVANWGRMTAERLGLPPNRAELVYEAALLHDLGKIVLDERVLNKPAKLTPREWEQIKQHPQLGAEILKEAPFLETIVPWVAYHHERPDGKGYPHKLQSDQIPLEARIIAVVDAFDAMVGGETPSQQRQYRSSMTTEEALAELRRGSGTQFDPSVVKIFEAIVRKSTAGSQQTAAPFEKAS